MNYMNLYKQIENTKKTYSKCLKLLYEGNKKQYFKAKHELNRSHSNDYVCYEEAKYKLVEKIKSTDNKEEIEKYITDLYIIQNYFNNNTLTRDDFDLLILKESIYAIR